VHHPDERLADVGAHEAVPAEHDDLRHAHTGVTLLPRAPAAARGTLAPLDLHPGGIPQPRRSRRPGGWDRRSMAR
jgi:hypothetical protein